MLRHFVLFPSVWTACLATLSLSLASIGCSPTGDTNTASNDGSSSKPTRYLLTSEPEGVISVGEARKTIQDGDPVALVGLIGGSPEPFVEGLAAFTLVDPQVPYCQPDEGCPTPWDYCCQQDLVQDNIATIKIVDESQSPVLTDARELLGVAELAEVVATGIARRDDQGNLTVSTDHVFVRKP